MQVIAIVIFVKDLLKNMEGWKMCEEFYGKWEIKNVMFEMFRRWGEGIKDHLEMECYTKGHEEQRKIFAKTTRYVDPMDFLLYCECNYDFWFILSLVSV